MNKLRRKKLSVPVAEYSLCFLIFAVFCVLSFFWIDGKSMMDQVDGTFGHYSCFVSSGRLIRTFLKNIFVDHVFEFPMWDMTIGMGADTIITYNPLATPLTCIFSALVPVEYSEYAFELIAVIRLYLAGLAFLFFVNGKGYKNTNAVAGALVYVFSSTMNIEFMQLSFSFTYILFPLLLLGADKVWKGQKSILYVLVLSYSTIQSYYFTYMMLILLVVYCVIRFICEEGRSVKKFFPLFERFVVLTLTSLSIGIGFILPNLLNLTKLNRLKSHFDIKLIDLEIFKRFFSYGFTCIQADGDALIGVSSFAFVAVVCLFVSRKKEPVIKWCTALCFISFAFPFICSMFNGFNYPSFRYIFALILCISYMVTVSFDSVKLFKGKVWYFSLALSVIYGAICFLFIDRYSTSSALSLIISVSLTGIINLFDRHLDRIRDKLYIAVIYISCVILGYSCFHVYLNHTMRDFGSLYDTVFVSDGMNIRKTINDKKYRSEIINADFADNIMNSSMASDVSGFDFYFNNQDQHIERYYTALEILGNPMEFSHTGFRCRCYTEIMNGCKYIVRSESNKTCIRAPYSYDLVENYGDYSLYRSNRGVSLVYFYDDVISNDTFMELNPLTRETNLMHSMVVEDPQKPEAAVVSDAVPVPYEIESYTDITVDGNKLIVENEDGGYITIKPGDIEPGQISLYLKGMRSSDVNNWHYRNAVALMGQDGKPVAIEYSAQYSTTYQYYFGNDDVVYSFEEIDEKIGSIELIILYPGTYYLDDIQIYSRPYTQMEQTLDTFYDHADMEDISYEYSGNHLNISATADTDRYLYIAVPFADGWKAKVDGNPVQIIRANIAFMAIPLTSGTHSIEMTYTTPNMYSGLCISAIGILLYAGYLIFEKKTGKRGS